MSQIREFLFERKYEVLLAALAQHLFIGIFLHDMAYYTTHIWAINMFVLGMASIGVFIEKGRWKNTVRSMLFTVTLGFPLAIPLVHHLPPFMLALNLAYILFFAFIFVEVFKFLVRPGYINTDIISAAACGYLLLLEISVFLMQFYFYREPSSFTGVSTSDPATTFIDFVYFCSITLTSIGYGDILPHAHYTKLATAFLGIVGQFYSVVLVGILISKFTGNAPEYTSRR